MNVPRSSFYRNLNAQRADTALIKPSPAPDLVEKIHTIRAEFPGYGYRQGTHALRHLGVVVNHKKVMRLMRQEGLAIKRRSRVVVTTHSDDDFLIYRNLTATSSRQSQIGCG